MKKIFAAGAVVALLGTLLTGCNTASCEDGRLTSSVIEGKGGGSKSRSWSKTKPKGGSSGSKKRKHRNHDWGCDD